MNISTSSVSGQAAWSQLSASVPVDVPAQGDLEVREKFQDFVAGTFYSQMLKSLRATQGKPAYLHGGPAEEMFQQQLDQTVAEDLARNQGSAFSDPLFGAFSQHLHRSQSAITLRPESMATINP